MHTLKPFPHEVSRTLLCLLVLFIISCSDDADEGPSGVSISNEAATQFANISSAAKEAQRLWPTFDFLTTFPILVLLDEPDAKGTQGYIINAPEVLPEGSEFVDESQTSGYTAYRNNQMAKQALDQLGEFGIFIFEFPYEGTVYFVIYDSPRPGYFYDEYKNVTGCWESLVLTHELFHKFQFDQWQIQDQWVQNILDYPFEIELLTWHLYYYDLMAEAHLAANANEAESYLRKYVGAMTKMQALDPSEEQLVTNMGTYQELIEGSARYIESFSALPKIYPGILEDPTHGWRGVLDNAEKSDDVLLAIGFRLWYHSGAAATHLLQLLEVDVQSEYANFITPFELARNYLSLDEATLSELQAEISNDADWISYETRAEKMMSLVEN